METERPHRTTTTSASNNNSNSSSTSELFVCFTSRLSSSSMKLSSKSLLSPSRARDPPQISLSSSLSRRLKSNGSMKGGQASPMFPTTGGKRRGAGFENPEPSSPKVTCIGQVRVKTKKQGKKMRARSKRRGSETSFRKAEQPDLTRQNSSQSFGFQNHQSLQQECLKHRNQRWVHLPLTICEALREFSCFFPCRSSCTSGEREKEEKGLVTGVEGGLERGSGGGHGREGSCGAAFARWMVALQEGDGKGRTIELVMEPEEEEDGGGEKSERSRSQRRHVFEDIDIDLVEEGKKHEEFGGEEEEKARVSICIPPKNALLLMRCRSDPVKMAALANRFWESPLKKDQDQVVEEQVDSEEDNEEQEEEGEQEQHVEMEEDEEQEEKEAQMERKTEEDSICERESVVCLASEEDIEISLPEQQEEAEAKPDVKESFDIESRMNPESNDFSEAKEEQDKSEDEDGKEDANHHQGENFSCVLLTEPVADLNKLETEETHLRECEEKNPREKENDESTELSSSPATSTASEPENGGEAVAEAATTAAAAAAEGSTEEEEEAERAPTHEGSDRITGPESKEQEIGSKEEQRGKETLPECLLLMMCEPKLSMEVSKETWVCSTDFIRRLPERPAVKVDGGGKRVSLDSSKVKPKSKPPQPQMQPPRSSCSFPAVGGGAGISMATMIEQKLVGSRNGYEPFVLTRCKSEPMRSAAKLAPEACFWNNRKLEPTAPLGVGAPAGVGF